MDRGQRQDGALHRRAVLAGAPLLLGLAGCGRGRRDVPFVPTPPDTVETMLGLAGLRPGDVVYDLGSGDGRIVIAAAQRHGVRAVGVDIDSRRIREARRNAARAGVEDRVEFRQQDLFDADIRDASVVTLYLLPRVNSRLRPRLLQELRPGTRVVSHAFDMDGWPPERTVTSPESGRTVYLWVVPPRDERAAGP
jgi:SAM-dependent methyltransferase